MRLYFRFGPGLLVPLGTTGPVAVQPPAAPVGREVFVKAGMIVKTNAEATTNIRIEAGSIVTFPTGGGTTLAQRRQATSRELGATLADLFAKAEEIKAGFTYATTPRPITPPRNTRGLIGSADTRSTS